MSKPIEKLEAIFEAALALETGAQRADYLNRACPEPELRREVEALLAAHAQPDSVFTERTAVVNVSPSEAVGMVIGRYKLLEALGEGGFGSVWLAEQKEPVRRKVALKVIKLGMDTKQVVARFEAERQALALMDHPNIAKVLDASTTDTGRPYFVMELVRGIPITKFCDENKLATRERLDLFIKVCHAVQHAHQKGIIHRDLKPSNVLVTLHDGVPVPKVIDFGIAKATQQELTDKTIHTLFQQFIGTPAYVSPEQAEMSGLDIDTRSDIYSLGVLLYELLTGVTPFNAQTLMQSGLDEMRRIIREDEPKRPSTRLSTLEMAEASVLTKHRQEKLPALVSLVRGDLDWIVMKSLEKDRAQRYETANGLAADLKRHLNNEPVVARPPSTAYRVQKFVRRNKAGVIAGALLLLLLVAGVIGTSLGLARAERERRHAFDSATRATAASTEAQKARDLAEENLYYNRVALAHRELTAEPPNIGDAEQLLEKCPTPMRDWEWRYLKRLRLTEPITLGDARNNEVFSIAYSSDGRHLASACGDGKVRIWNLATGQLEQTLSAHTNFAFCVAFHPTDPTRIASAGADRQINLWDWKADVMIHSWPGHFVFEYGAAYSVAFSPDGRQLAALGEAGVANVWDTETFALIRALPGHELAVLSVAFSPDGKRLATGSRHGIVRLWDAATWELLRELGDYAPPISCVTFRPDSRQLAVTCFDSSVRIWDLDSPDRNPQSHFRGHASLAMGAAFSANGQRLATVGYDRVCALWEAASGRQVLVFRDLSDYGLCVRFSPDGNRLAASTSGGTVRIWDATPLAGEGDQSLLTLRYPKEVWAMDINPATNWLACAGEYVFSDAGGKAVPVQIWETGRDRLKRTLKAHGVIVFSLAFDPSGRFLASSGDDPSRLGNATVKVWDLATGAESFAVEQFEGIGVVFAVAYSRDGKRLVGAGSDGRLRVWDARTGRQVGVLGEHKREISMVTFSPDGKLVASAGTNNTVKLWDATRLDERQQHPVTFEAPRADVSTSVAFSPDSTRLGFARDDHAARIWDIATRKVVVVLESRHHRFLSLAFSSDGRWVASGGGDCTVKLWDARTGRLLHTFRGHTGAMKRLAFVQLPEGLRLVSASLDGTVKYWDVTPFER